MKTLLIQHVYPNHGYLPMVLEYVPRHAEYCRKFGIDYEFFMGELMPYQKGEWDKVILVKEALLSNYELVIWLDADAIIKDLYTDLKDVPLGPDRIGAVWFPVPEPHFNVGVLYFRNGPNVRQFVDDWAAGYPGEDYWHEQRVFNDLANTPSKSNEAFIMRLPPQWNSSRDHNWVSDAIIAAGHGIGPLQQRQEFLQKCL